MASINSPSGRFSITQSYLATRGQAINFPAKFFKIDLKKDDIYGVVVDIPMSPQILATMVCFINGAANLYFNNGTEYTGAAQKYRNLVQASRTLVINIAPLLKKSKKVTAYDLPSGRDHNIYLLTKGGIYKTVLKPGFIPETETELRTAYVLYQRVLQELRNCQLKDEADRRMNPAK